VLLLSLCAAVFLTASAAPPATAPARAPANFKSQRVALRRARADPVEIDLVHLPPGKIVIADATGKPVEHQVNPVWIARYETRWDEYDVFWEALDLTAEEQRKVGREELQKTRTTKPFWPPDSGLDPERHEQWESPGREGFPANCVHFDAARRYCAWLSKHTGRTFRLPTEAEWEYACRTGGPPVKLDAKSLDAVAWFKDNAGNKTHAVGEKQPNAWGLYDMLGNVGEFVIRDPKDEKGLLAGGSYKDAAEDVHSGARERDTGAWQKNDDEDPPSTSWLNKTVHHVGFRVVMED
jgi:formylglycine-generating enzyme required for sulfatase activity